MSEEIRFTPEKIDLRIFDQADNDQFVGVDILTAILRGLQKAVYAIAKDEEDCYQSNPTRQFKQRYTIRCGIPRPGSYAMPVEFGVSDERFPEASTVLCIGSVGEKLQRCFAAIADGSVKAFREVRTPALRQQLLNAFREILPKTGAKWKLGIGGSRYGDNELVYTWENVKSLKEISGRFIATENIALQTVTGLLIRMDFERRCLVLKYPPTETELECYYEADFEAELFENRREFLQVTGSVTYENDRETPKRIADVNDIQILDMSDFSVDSFPYGEEEIRFARPLLFSPELTESKQFITLVNPSLGLDIIAQTREELYEELIAELQMLWGCTKMEDSSLCNDFREQKQNLLSAVNAEVEQ